MSLIPTSQQVPGEWMSVDEMGARPAFIPGGEHAPLSPQSSVASSGSEQTEEQSGSRNTFQEDGSGMKGTSNWSFLQSSQQPASWLNFDLTYSRFKWNVGLHFSAARVETGKIGIEPTQ